MAQQDVGAVRTIGAEMDHSTRFVLVDRKGRIRGYYGIAEGDPVAKLLHARSSDGSFGRLVNVTTFAIFALRAAGQPANDPVVRAAGRWLESQQNPDGGFGFAGRGASEDVDDTAAALQGVIDAGGLRSAVVTRAVASLRHSQNPDGGYPQQIGGESNAQSTAWAAQGLAAAGQKVSAVRREGGRSPLAYLESLIAPDGSVRYSRTSAQTPVWVTAQALTALAGKPFPIAAPRGVSAVPHKRSAVLALTPPGARSHPPAAAAATAAQPAHRAHVAHAGSRRADANAEKRASATAARLSGEEQTRLAALARAAGMLVGVVLAPELR